MCHYSRGLGDFYEIQILSYTSLDGVVLESANGEATGDHDSGQFKVRQAIDNTGVFTPLPLGKYTFSFYLASFGDWTKNYKINLLSVELDFYLCTDCSTWPSSFESAPPAEDETEEAVDTPPDLTDPDVLFASAVDLFSEQYSIVYFMTAGEELTIELDFAVDPEYEEIMFETNFGQAAVFTDFDESTGVILISPDVSVAGEYTLSLDIMQGMRQHQRTMYLSVKEPVVEGVDAVEDSSSSESEDIIDDTIEENEEDEEVDQQEDKEPSDDAASSSQLSNNSVQT